MSTITRTLRNLRRVGVKVRDARAVFAASY